MKDVAVYSLGIGIPLVLASILPISIMAIAVGVLVVSGAIITKKTTGKF